MHPRVLCRRRMLIKGRPPCMPGASPPSELATLPGCRQRRKIELDGCGRTGNRGCDLHLLPTAAVSSAGSFISQSPAALRAVPSKKRKSLEKLVISPRSEHYTTLRANGQY